MADDPKKRGKPDRTRVSVTEKHERRYWSRKFGVTPVELEAIVKAVGVMVVDVEREAKRRHAVTQKS